MNNGISEKVFFLMPTLAINSRLSSDRELFLSIRKYKIGDYNHAYRKFIEIAPASLEKDIIFLEYIE